MVIIQHNMVTKMSLGLHSTNRKRTLHYNNEARTNQIALLYKLYTYLYRNCWWWVLDVYVCVCGGAKGDCKHSVATHSHTLTHYQRDIDFGWPSSRVVTTFVYIYLLVLLKYMASPKCIWPKCSLGCGHCTRDVCHILIKVMPNR